MQPLSQEPSGAEPLGSLAQAARQKQLKSVRTTLLIIGILTIVLNLADLLMAESAVRDAMRQQGVNAVPPEMMRSILLFVYILDGMFLAVGIAFVILGLLVHLYPVPMTITALVLYIIGTLVMVLLNLGQLHLMVIALLVRGLFIVALSKAVGSAIAYERERNMEPAAPAL
jgi:hypothetical protein